MTGTFGHMASDRSRRRAMVLVRATAVLLSVSPAAAQIVPIRTVPLPRWQMFDRLPSTSHAMGGVRMAAADSLLDPFVNPAFGSRIEGGRLFLAPATYRTNTAGEEGITLTPGGVVRSGPWFAGAAFSWQDVSVTDPIIAGCGECRDLGLDPEVPTPGQTNVAGHLLIGRRFTRAGLAIGASVSWERQAWVQGLKLLYASSARIEHRGHGTGIRIGAVKDFPGRRQLSALAFQEQSSATHDVLFLDWRFDSGPSTTRLTPRLEHNADRYSVRGGELQFRWPLRTPGWQGGVVVAGNLAAHPKLPDYVIQSLQTIPRDPGSSKAASVGLGLWKTGARTEHGYELAVEPAWSNTWADAETPVATATGGTIAVGQKTVENWFDFVNVAVRAGFGHREPIGQGPEHVVVRGGFQLYRVGYSLRQLDYVSGGGRKLSQTWVELTPTWGLDFGLRRLTIRYRGSATATDLRDLIGSKPTDVTVLDPPSVLAAPIQPIRFDGTVTTLHQLSIVVPIH